MLILGGLREMGCEFGRRDGTAVDSGSGVGCSDGHFGGHRWEAPR